MNHIEFCLKYPEVVMNSDDSELMVKYMIDKNMIPIVDCFKVARFVKFYNDNPNIFSKFENLKIDWNKMISKSKNTNNL